MNLLMLMGLPRSGKSTKATIISQAFPGGAPIICPDDIRLALHGQQFYGPAEPFVWATAKVMAKALARRHELVILDATNITRRRRDDWKYGWTNRYILHIPTDKQTCIERAMAGSDAAILAAIERMAIQLELPEEDEGLVKWATGPYPFG